MKKSVTKREKERGEREGGERDGGERKQGPLTAFSQVIFLLPLNVLQSAVYLFGDVLWPNLKQFKSFAIFNSSINQRL